MADRTELLEGALDSLPEGIALAGIEGRLAFWNRAAEDITGHRCPDLLGRPVREVLETLIVGGTRQWIHQTSGEVKPGSGSLVHIHHRLGHNLPAVARVLVLRDGLGGRIGTGVVFHPSESLDALPHGETGTDARVGQNQAELEERLEAEYEDFVRGETPLGVLWITVDQAHEMRGTHGARACEAMFEKVERTLANGLKPAEEMGQWGDDEFLVLSHERTAESLAAHAQTLAGLARTTDFRWWGDRVSLTVSIGAAQAEQGESLAQLLERAQAAMLSSVHLGGNHITPAMRRQPCLPS
jgi:diguanylate cyclase (GGDEF)-like protein/PAS domain S-box-containing protein